MGCLWCLVSLVRATSTGPAPLLLDLVAGFSAEQLKAALEYCRDWNTNSRTCHVAQAMLQAILVRHPPRVRRPLSDTC